ncbi:MAG: hypothetical protein AB1649_19920 [Chloroflexota bacterium]
MESYADFATKMTAIAVFEIFFAVVVFIAARLLAKGKPLAIWLYGAAVGLHSALYFAMGHKPNYFVLGFAVLMIWQMFKLRNEWELV